MTTIHKLNQDLKEIRSKIFKIVDDENNFSSKEIFIEDLEKACKEEDQIELEIKNCVIHNYKGHEKFSKEVLDYIYKMTLSTIEEHTIDLEKKHRIIF